jgi:hypothetical protein
VEAATRTGLPSAASKRQNKTENKKKRKPKNKIKNLFFLLVSSFERAGGLSGALSISEKN